jgi:REP element-mobilizing transposase RayT
MPRIAREKSKSGIYHIILRGVNRQTIFEDEEDAEKFLQTLKKYKEESGYKIYAYCLMGNHIHILVKEEKEDLSIAMRRIGASYVYWYNLKYDRSGHLFQDRYKSEVVEDERYLLTVVRYIHQNPLKAGLVKDVKEYKWSSYSEYIGKYEIIDADFLLKIFNEDVKEALSMFEDFHKEESKIECLDVNYKKRIKDSEAVEIIKQACNISYCADLQKINKINRDKYLRILKEKDLSTRQISRLTGISRHIILKANA